MATLTLRILTNSGDITKGSTLSSAELDQNLISLNNQKFEKSGDTITGNLNFSGTGLRITGDLSGAPVDRVSFQTTTPNAYSAVQVMPSGTGTSSAFNAFNASDPSNSAYAQMYVSSTAVQLASGVVGTGTYVPMSFHTGGGERLRIETNGDITLPSVITSTTGGLVHRNNSASGFIPYPTGGQLQTQSQQTGAIKITLPVFGATDMITFWVDIYDYSTGETISIFCAGYNYTTNTWINTSALILSTKDDKNFTVRFGGDATNAAVWIGETSTVWDYPQVVIRDVQVGYSATAQNYATGWGVSIVTAFDTVSLTNTNNYPAAKTTSSFSYSSTYVPGSYAYSNQHLDATTSPFMSYATMSGSQYYPMIKSRITGGTKTVNFSIGALHNSDNTIDMQLHRINSDGTLGKTIVRWVDSGFTYYGTHVVPDTTNTYDLGSTSLRWRNIYTQDLHLSNGIGDYTIVEGVENLYLVNNKTNKSFKFALIEVDPAEVPEKSKVT